MLFRSDLLDGTAQLPSPAEMRREIASYHRMLRKRYVASKRHTIQVDFYPYLREIAQERRAGRRRRRRGRGVVPARPAALTPA